MRRDQRRRHSLRPGLHFHRNDRLRRRRRRLLQYFSRYPADFVSRDTSSAAEYSAIRLSGRQRADFRPERGGARERHRCQPAQSLQHQILLPGPSPSVPIQDAFCDDPSPAVYLQTHDAGAESQQLLCAFRGLVPRHAVLLLRAFRPPCHQQRRGGLEPLASGISSAQAPGQADRRRDLPGGVLSVRASDAGPRAITTGRSSPPPPPTRRNGGIRTGWPP